MLSRRPLLCLVTDRRRLCAGCDAETTRRCLAAQIRQAVAAGVDLVQVRERDLGAAPLAAIVRDAVDVARGSATRIVVNDRLDVAIACGADGVHLPADSLRPAEARRLAAEPFLVGASVHSVEEAVAAAGADYLVAGTVFPTASKAALDRLLGPDGLAEIARAAAAPVLAIGGVTLGRVARVATAGAAGIAAIGLFMGGSTMSPCRTAGLDERVARVRRAFDSAKPSP